MPSELASLRLLVITVLALGLIVGLVKRRTVGAVLGRMVLLAVLSPFLLAFVGGLYESLTPAGKALFGVAGILLLPIVLLLLLGALIRVIFGRHVADEVVGHLLYDFLRALISAPTRVLRRVRRLLTGGFYP